MLVTLKPEKTYSASGTLLKRGGEAPGAEHWVINRPSNHFPIEFGPYNQARVIGPKLPVELNEPIGIAVTYNAETSRYTMFVDGQVWGWTDSIVKLANNDILVGDSSSLQVGQIHRVMLWDAALSPSEVNQIDGEAISTRHDIIDPPVPVEVHVKPSKRRMKGNHILHE